MTDLTADRSLIGTSLSMCVADILSGKVTLEEVLFIVAGTAAETDAHWDKIFEAYRPYWSDDPETAIEIARDLIRSGRIFQPRLSCLPYFGNILKPSRRSGRHWFRQVPV